MSYALELKNVTKRYHDFTLDHVSIALPEGCVMGFIGDNGAGKSITIRAVLDLIRRDEGSIQVLGQTLDSQNKALKEHIGVVMDESSFPDNICLQNINSIMKSCHTTWNEARFLQYAKTFSLPEKKPVKDYSRGMKMKLSIAAALSHGAELLILDEATSGLDPVVRDEVLDLLYDFMQDESHAVLLSSHITSDLDKIADNITFIHHGRVLLSEGRDELIDRHGVLRCTEEQLNALDPDAVRAVRKGAFGCEALVKRDGIPENWPVEPVSVEQIMMFLTKGEEVR